MHFCVLVHKFSLLDPFPNADPDPELKWNAASDPQPCLYPGNKAQASDKKKTFHNSAYYSVSLTFMNSSCRASLEARGVLNYQPNSPDLQSGRADPVLLF